MFTLLHLSLPQHFLIVDLQLSVQEMDVLLKRIPLDG